MMHYYMPYGFMGVGWLFQIIILILFFVVLWWLVKNSGRFGFQSSETAEEILKKRVAKGEITVKEYNQLKKEL